MGAHSWISNSVLLASEQNVLWLVWFWLTEMIFYTLIKDRFHLHRLFLRNSLPPALWKSLNDCMIMKLHFLWPSFITWDSRFHGLKVELCRELGAKSAVLGGPNGRDVCATIFWAERVTLEFPPAIVSRWAVHCPLEYWGVHQVQYDLSEAGRNLRLSTGKWHLALVWERAITIKNLFQELLESMKEFGRHVQQDDHCWKSRFMKIQEVHAWKPSKTIMELKNGCFRKTFRFKGSIFRFYVSFQGFSSIQERIRNSE